jgi:mitochondrial ribonuclease P protein 1
MRQEGRKVPSKISSIEWERLLELHTVSRRRKYLQYLFLNEMSNENKKRKKEEKQILRQERLDAKRELANSDQLVYGLGYNSFFLKIYDTTMNQWHNNKLTRAMQFGQKLIIDCSYDKHMTLREADNCAKQLVFSFATNRLHDQPFDIHFCNFDPQSNSGKKFRNAVPTLYDKDFPINVHSESHTELFDKKKLVYLTPHCREELTEYNPDDVYIVGAMVDKAVSEPLSLAKAKRHGLRMAKLPLDRYLMWGIGSKSLAINQMIEILLEMNATNDWKKAFEFVPKRKLFQRFEQSNKSKIFLRKNHRVTFSKNLFDDHEEHDFRDRQNFGKSKANHRSNDKYQFNLENWGKKNKN